jgi:hypothetical protein
MFPNCPTPPLKEYINLKGLPKKTACTIFAFENILYLGEFEAEFKKASARESGAQGVLFDEKNRGSEISWHCPFKGECTYPTAKKDYP